MDSNNIADRLKRYAQVTGAATGLAARLAGQRYFGIEISAENHSVALKNILGQLKGPLMKVAQFLATIPGALPPEYAQAFLELQAQAPAMGKPFVRRRMTTELGVDWQRHFAAFDFEPAAAASLGQVHKAQLSDGRWVACKLQYPNMEAAIQADLAQLKIVLSLYERAYQALKTEDIQEEIMLRLEEELDYHHEADNIRRYARIFEEDAMLKALDVRIPSVVESLSTPRLLTMEWMDGVSVLEKKNASQEERDRLGVVLFESWYRPFYTHFVIHGDPHPGNYKIASDGTLHLLDFGCVRVFSPSFVSSVVYLYRALLHNDPKKIREAFERWGFNTSNEEVVEAMTHWARLLYAPLLVDKKQPIQEKLDGKLGWETAVKVHEAIAKAGGIRPPKEFVFMDRAAVGIGSVMMHLRSEANWHQLFEAMIQSFPIE